MENFDEKVEKIIESINIKLNQDELEFIKAIIDAYDEQFEKIKKAQRIYLKSLQKHNEKNEKIDDTAIMMYTALLDDRYDEYE